MSNRSVHAIIYSYPALQRIRCRQDSPCLRNTWNRSSGNPVSLQETLRPRVWDLILSKTFMPGHRNWNLSPPQQLNITPKFKFEVKSTGPWSPRIISNHTISQTIYLRWKSYLVTIEKSYVNRGIKLHLDTRAMSSSTTWKRTSKSWKQT